MNMDGTLGEKGLELFLPVCDRSVTHDQTVEIVIPEHQPEARKLLSVSARVLPPAKYVTSSAIELSGGIDCTALYIGADGEVYSAQGSGEYECSAPVEKTELTESAESAQVTACCSCDSVSGRIATGGKITVKCRLSSRIRAYGVYGGDGVAADAEMLYEVAENIRLYPISTEPIELSGEINGVADDVRIVSADGKVTVKEISKTSEGVSVSGEAVAELLTAKENCPLSVMTVKLPFTALADCEGDDDGFLGSAWGELTDITVTVDEGAIHVSVIAVVRGEMAKNVECRYPKDAYFLDRESECKAAVVRLPTLKVCTVGNFSWSERVPLTESSLREGADIIRAKCTPVLTGCDTADGKYIFTGSCRYNLLCEKNGEYFTSEIERPIRYELSGRPGENTVFDITAREITCRGRIDGDDLCVDSEIGVCAFVSSSDRAEVLTEIISGEDLEKKGCRMTVYFPADNESRWDVAKKYHVPASTLTEEARYYLF